MFRQVIVGVDGTPSGRDAIALAVQLVDRDGQIGLGHVEPGESAPGRASNLEFDRVQREDSLLMLEREQEAVGARAQPLPVVSESAARGLHHLAEEHAADLLVVGSCHRGRVGGVLLGDDVRDTLNGSPCAVAVAPHGYVASARPLGSIGVAYDGSAPSRLALDVARGLAAREDAAVRALRVLSRRVTPLMAEDPSRWKDATEADVRAARDALDLPPEVERDVVLGVAAEQLERFSGQVDLLVVGSRDRSPIRRVLLGSTSQQLAHRARCPLLVVPAGALRLDGATGTTITSGAAAV